MLSEYLGLLTLSCWHSLEHNQNAPSNRPLLRAHQPSPLTRGRQFRNVHRNLSGADTHTKPIQNPPDNQHTDVLRSAYDDRTNNPDSRTDHDRLLPSQDVREEARDERTEPASTRHRGSDAALDVGIRTCAGRGIGGNRARLEIAFVLGRAEDGGHLGLSVGLCMGKKM